MVFPLVFLFIVIPLLELYVLIEVGSWIGAAPTIALVVLTAVVGAVLLRWQGFGLLRRARAMLLAGELPAIEMLEGALIVVAGALLLVPGFVTDTVGFLLLVPWVRRGAILWFLSRRGLIGAAGPRREPPRGPYTIEGEYRREDSPEEIARRIRERERRDRDRR